MVTVEQPERTHPTPVLDATDKALAAADHLTDMDSGAIGTLRALALKIDMEQVYMDELSRDAAAHRLRPPSQDNVSIPTYLKFCEALGLTPLGRNRASIEEASSTGGGKLAVLRQKHGAKTA